MRRSNSSNQKLKGWCLLTRVRFVFSFLILSACSLSDAKRMFCRFFRLLNFRGIRIGIPADLPGRVGEWLKPADCKSAAPCGLRRFESFPVHQTLLGFFGFCGTP